MLVLEQKEAARRLGITSRALRDWMQDPGFPDWSAGYDISAIKRWRDDRGRKGSDLDGKADAVRLATNLQKLEQAKTTSRLLNLKLEREEAKLLPRQAIEVFHATVLSGLADWCEQLPDLIAQILPPEHRETIRERLRDELATRREQLADELANCPHLK